MKIQLPVHVEAAATVAVTKYLAFDERYELKSVKIINDGAIAAHNTNYSIFKVFANDQATTAFEWSTQDTAEGALSDGVDADLTDKNTGKAIFQASGVVKITRTHAGTPASGVDAMLILTFEQARSY